MSNTRSYSSKLLDLVKTFLKLGVSSFGGPIAHIGYFHNEFVTNKKWLSDSQFSNILAICQFLPGPASSQLGFAIGLMRAGWLGAWLAFIAFTLPSAILLFVFAQNLEHFESQIGVAIIHGLKLVAVIVVFDALLSMSKKICTDKFTQLIAVASACLLLIFPSAWMQIVVIVFSGFIGAFFIKSSHAQSLNNSEFKVNYSKKMGGILFSLFAFLLLFLIFFPSHHFVFQVSSIFYQAGSFVFGGGHVVLPLLQESIVDSQLVSQPNFLAGYGAAQAMPGPMFAFAGYLGAIIPTGYDPIIGAALALLFMFAPGFLLIAAMLPVWQTLSKFKSITAGMTAINAAVVGVLGAALYDPIFTTSVVSSLDFVWVVLGVSLLMVIRLSPFYLVLFSVFLSVVFSLF